MNKELARWNNFKKVALGLSSRFVWVVSGIFSLMGFIGLLTTRTAEQAAMPKWMFYGFVVIGIGLSVVVNVLELALNSEKLDKIFNSGMEVMDIILWVGGFVAYLYDIYTNVLGLSLLMLGTINLGVIPVESKVIVIVWGILLAILPEPMYIKSIKMVYMATPEDKRFVKQQVQTPNSNVQEYLAKKYPDQFKK